MSRKPRVNQSIKEAVTPPSGGIENDSGNLAHSNDTGEKARSLALENNPGNSVQVNTGVIRDITDIKQSNEITEKINSLYKKLNITQVSQLDPKNLPLYGSMITNAKASKEKTKRIKKITHDIIQQNINTPDSIPPIDEIDYYNIRTILSKGCLYSMVIGERSNGKTFSSLDYMIENYLERGKQSAYIRRYREDLRGKRGETLFSNIVQSGRLRELSNGEYDAIKYQAGQWFLGTYDKSLGKIVTEEEPFCYGFALSETEHDKSTGYPNVDFIVFDEFMTRQYYLPNEFVLFMNCLSTIIRQRDDVRVVMLANTVNKYCPYFKEMGLVHVPEMEQGKIDVYKYGSTGLTIAVERCKRPKQGMKKSDMYFAFDNPQLQMITTGAWEIALYPHLPLKYDKSDILFTYFISFNQNLLQCEIIQKDDSLFTYIHRKSTPIQNENEDIIFTDEFDPRPNYFRNIRKPSNRYTKEIARQFMEDKIFYQDNEVGEVVRNYLKYCATEMHKL